MNWPVAAFFSGSGLILTLSLLTTQMAFAEIYETFIKPSDTDSRVQQGAAAHYVTYDTSTEFGPRLGLDDGNRRHPGKEQAAGHGA